MKKTLLVLGAAFFLSLGISAQSLKLKVDNKGKVGFVDESGKEVIACKYQSATPFEEGISVVSSGDKYGMIDLNGKVLIAPKYNEITPWGKGMFLLKSGKKYGIAGKDGKIALEVKYSYISPANTYGKAWVSIGGKVVNFLGKKSLSGAKYGVVNADGSIAIPANYKGLYEFSLNMIGTNPYFEGQILGMPSHALGDTLKTDGKYYGFGKAELSTRDAGVITGDNKVLMPMGKATWVAQPQSDMVRCYLCKKSKTTIAYYNVSTAKLMEMGSYDKALNDMKFWSHSDFWGEIAAINSTEGWKFIDKNGNVVLSGFSSVSHGQKAKAWAGYKENECIVIDNNGKPFFKDGVTFSAIRLSEMTDHQDIFAVSRDNKWGVINKEGATIVPFSYDNIYAIVYDFVFAKSGDNWGMVDLNNNVVVPLNYADLKMPTEAHPRFVWGKQASDSLWYAYDLTKKMQRKQGYKDAMNYKDGYAWVLPEGMVAENTPTMRCMMAKGTTDDYFNKVKASLFGSVIGEDGDVYAEGPYYIDVLPKLIKLMHANGNKKLTKSQNKKMMLYITRDDRSYPMQKIDEEDWDY